MKTLILGMDTKKPAIKEVVFKDMGATGTDHGHPSARTENLSFSEAEKLFHIILRGDFRRNKPKCLESDVN